MQKICVSWHNDIEGILLLEFEEGWSWSDFKQITVQLNSMIDNYSNPVVEVMDFQHCQQLPGNMFKHGRHILQQPQNPNIQAVVVVNANEYIHAVYRAFEKVFPSALINKWNLKITDNFEDAICQAHQLLHK